MRVPRDACALLGLTEYELRVYRAMLRESGATAYRLGRRSGVPLSRVYEVADNLVAKGVAFVVSVQPRRYAPVEPAALIAAARRSLNSALDALADELTAAKPAAPDLAAARALSRASDWIKWEADKHRRLLQTSPFRPGSPPS